MPDEKETRSEPIHVLLVEDNVDHAQLMEIILKKHEVKFNVSVARSGLECFEILKSEQPVNVVLLDYDLPMMSGLEILSEVKRLRQEIPVVLVTGKGDEKIAVKAMKQGAYDYLIKDKGYMHVLPRVIQQAIDKFELEKRLYQTERKYQNLIENAYDAIFIEHPSSGKILDVNRRASQLTGYSRDELIGMFVRQIHPVEYLARLKQINARVKKQGYGSFDDLAILTRQGERVPIDVSVSLVDYGAFKVLQKVMRDVTEKKRLEDAILESKKQLSLLFDSILDIIYVIDQDFTIILANRKAAELHHSTFKAMIGQRCYRYFGNSNEPCPGCPAVLTFESKKMEMMERATDRENYLIRSHPFSNFETQSKQVVMIMQDVSAERRLQQKLIQSEKLATIGMLSSGIAHEIRNPLNIIEAARYSIAESIEDEDFDIADKLEMISKNIHRAATIINNLLEFSRRSRVEREPIQINDLIDKTVSLIQKELRARNIEYRPDYGRNLPDVFFNLDSLKQVLMSIIFNAQQAMTDGGDLKISTLVKADDNVVVKIQDTGCGIARKNLPHIFSPFFTTREVGQGTGLGMYVSHTILKKEGGDVQVESEEGVGTVFTIFLPIYRNGAN